MSALMQAVKAGPGFNTFVLGMVTGAIVSRATASSIDPEWLYLILAAAVAVVTGAVELWRQRGVESKISDIESKILDLSVEVKYHGKLIDDLNGNGGDDDGS